MPDAVANDPKNSNETEEDPRQSKQLIKRIISSIGDGIYAVDRDFNFIYINERIAKLVGREPSEMIGKNSRQFFPKLIGTAYEENLVDAMLKREFRRFEWKGSYSDEVWEISVVPFEEGLIVNSRDITERKKAEEALIQSEKKYRRLYETSLDGIVARDLDGNMIDCNQAYARMVGYTKEELATLTWRQVLPERWHEQRERIAKEIIETGGSIVFEREYRRKNGEAFPASVRTWRLTDDKGKTIGTWSLVRDVTEQKELQRRLEEHSKNLERIVEERTKQLRDSERLATIGATAGMVGHDIRNPLQAIMSDVFLVKSDLSEIPEGEEKEGIKESLDDIEKNVDYINKIVQDLQDYARPLTTAMQETSLDMLCKEETLKREIPDNIEASCEVEDDAKKLVADPALLKRILANLVNNAVQAMPKGGKLDVRAFRDAEDIVITVQDTGHGIPEEVRPKLFTPLFTTKSKGQGFGLAVVKRITETLGGSVTFESELGRGTKFIVRLPSQGSKR